MLCRAGLSRADSMECPPKEEPSGPGMTVRRIALVWIAVLAVIAGSYAVASHAPPSASPVAATDSLAVDDTLPLPTMKSTDDQLAFWRGRIEQTPQDFISLTYLGQTFLRKARETGDVADYER